MAFPNRHSGFKKDEPKGKFDKAWGMSKERFDISKRPEKGAGNPKNHTIEAPGGKPRKGYKACEGCGMHFRGDEMVHHKDYH